MAEKKPNVDEKTQNKIREIQALEQNMQSLLLQKQAFQMELNETENALSEIKDSKDDIFKVVSNIMIRTDKTKVTKDLEQKKELLSLRLKSIEKQESQFSDHLQELRDDVMKSLK
jgi:prefoldin beta subunit